MKMRAMVFERHGGPEVLQERELQLEPPGPCEVRVRVRAVAMNHMDIWVRRGLPGWKGPLPFRLGCDIAGEVDEAGPGARGAAPGMRVMLQPALSCGVCRACLSGSDNLCRGYRILGEHTHGGYAEYINVPDVNLLPIPGDLGFVQAAALPLCTMTAWQAMYRKAKVGPTDTVLIHAAGSGVSSLAIQLCKLVGARVVATVGSQDKVQRARELGADHVLVYTEQDFVQECKRLTDKRGVDVVFDHVGGEVFAKSILATAWGGKVVTVGATAGHQVSIDLRQVFFRQIEVLGSTMGSKGDLHAALPLIAAGKLRPVVGRELPLWQAQAAHEALESRSVFGKVVLQV
jgi:NADPH:quinone reductase-like Zn-dependent oxidoreductase